MNFVCVNIFQSVRIATKSIEMLWLFVNRYLYYSLDLFEFTSFALRLMPKINFTVTQYCSHCRRRAFSVIFEKVGIFCALNNVIRSIFVLHLNNRSIYDWPARGVLPNITRNLHFLLLLWISNIFQLSHKHTSHICMSKLNGKRINLNSLSVICVCVDLVQRPMRSANDSIFVNHWHVIKTVFILSSYA